MMNTKHNSFFKIAAVLIVAAFTFISNVLSAPAIQSGKIIKVQGAARISFDSQSWQPLKKGMVVSTGSMIQTSENASVEISLNGAASGNNIRLGGDSVLHVDQLSSDGGKEDTELDLKSGALTVHSGVIANGSRFEIKFADGIVGVRSGILTMNTLGLIDVAEGKIVAVMFRDAQPHVVTGGHHFDTTTGQVSDLVVKGVAESAPAKVAAPAAPGLPARKF